MAGFLLLLALACGVMALGGRMADRYPRLFDRAASIVFGGAVDDTFIP